ncbi:MAG TPA: hypothetical protein VF008_28460 [Niastella sp.]
MKKLLLLFILAFPCLFKAWSQNEKTSIAIFPFASTTVTYKEYAAVIQQLVVEILRKKSSITLIDRSNDSLQVKELDKTLSEHSVNASGSVEQGKLLVGAQMIAGTLSNISIEEKTTTGTNSSGSPTIRKSYTANLNFAMQLSDVETGKVISHKLFGVSQGGLLSSLGLDNILSSADTKEEAIANAIKSSRKQIVKWFNEIYPPEINIFKIEERNKHNKPETVLVTGVDDSFTKGSQFYVHEIEMIDAGNGKTLKRIKKIARLKIKEMQGDITICKVSDGEDILEEKMNNKTTMVFTAN